MEENTYTLSQSNFTFTQALPEYDNEECLCIKDTQENNSEEEEKEGGLGGEGQPDRYDPVPSLDILRDVLGAEYTEKEMKEDMKRNVMKIFL